MGIKANAEMHSEEKKPNFTLGTHHLRDVQPISPTHFMVSQEQGPILHQDWFLYITVHMYKVTKKTAHSYGFCCENNELLA